MTDQKSSPLPFAGTAFDVVAIAASAGGLAAIRKVLSRLPAELSGGCRDRPAYGSQTRQLNGSHPKQLYPHERKAGRGRRHLEPIDCVHRQTRLASPS